MIKILRFGSILFCLLTVLASTASATLYVFDKPRYLPAVSFYGDSGKAYKLTDFREDLLMALVWSRNCGPCLRDLKPLQVFADKVEESGIKVILISPEDDWKSIDERRLFLKRFNADKLVNYNDRKQNFRDGLGVMVTPTMLLVNRNGEEIGQITGSTEWDDPRVIEYILKLKNGLYSEKLDEHKATN